MKIMITVISELTCKYVSSHSILIIVLISNNFQYHALIWYYCFIVIYHTILNIRLYSIANVTLRSYITIRMLPI